MAKHIWYFTVVISVFILIALTASAAGPPAFRDGRVLMGFKPGVTAVRINSILAAVGAVKERQHLAGTFVLAVPPGHVKTIIQALLTFPEVRYAEPDYENHPDGLPNDP